MSPTVHLGILIEAAASAIGLTERQLRAWLDREQVQLDGDKSRAKRAWRRLSPFDVLRLSLVSRLVSYGFSPADADDEIATPFQDWVELAGSDPTPAQLVEVLKDRAIFLRSNGAGAPGEVSFVDKLSKSLPPFLKKADGIFIRPDLVMQAALKALNAEEA